VLLAIWAVLTVAALAFIVTLGSNCPNADEWGFVAPIAGSEPLGPWLWAQHNEHRLPLPRLVYCALFQATHDFRAGSILQIALLSATSLGLMLLASRLRGRPYWTDLFFPLSLLHVGHWENLLIGYNLCFALILVLETAIGACALGSADSASRLTAGTRAGVLMVLLCLCGGGGVVAALPVAGWLVYLASRSHTLAGSAAGAKRSRWRTALLLAFAAFPFLYLAFYLDGYQRPGHHPRLGDGGLDVLRVAAQVLAIAFGHGIARYWLYAFGGIVLLAFFTGRAMIRDFSDRGKRPAILGLMAVAAGIVAVALTIGMGRAGIDVHNGLASRYAYLTWPLLALLYLFWSRRGGWAGKWIPLALCLAAAIAYPMNMLDGLKEGSRIHATLAVVQDEARRGVPPERIVRHFTGTFQAHQEERAIRAMPMLREAGIGAFAEKRP